MAWSGLASTFAGLLFVLVMGARPSQRLMIAMSLTGLIVATVWRLADLHVIVYEGMPGILASMAVYGIGALMEREKQVV